MIEASASRTSLIWQAESGAPVVTRIAIAGDFLPAGNISLNSDSSWRDAAAALMPHFDDVATTFANLECAVGVQGLPASPLNGIGQIVSAEPVALDYLTAIRCQAVSIANNHAHDFGEAGAQRTRESLSKQNLVPLGAGRSLSSAPEVFIWFGPGTLRVGFWAAAKAARDIATRKSPGVEPTTTDRATQAIGVMKQHGATFCVALVHAGCLRTNRPAPEDFTLLRALARCGFDLVAASHSHRISGSEMILEPGGRPSFCFHGLGSIVSGYTASALDREGLIVIAGIDAHGKLASVSVRPVWLAENGIGTAPAPDVAQTILRRFESLSAEFCDGSYRDAFYREVSRGLVRLYIRDVIAAFRASGVRGLAHKAVRLRLCHVKRLMHRVFAT